MVDCVNCRAEGALVVSLDFDVFEVSIAWDESVDESEKEGLKFGIPCSFIRHLVNRGPVFTSAILINRKGFIPPFLGCDLGFQKSDNCQISEQDSITASYWSLYGIVVA